MYVALSEPVELTWTVSPLARVSPFTKLSVDSFGEASGSGPMNTAQVEVGFVTVTMPLTAVAVGGMQALPVTWKVRGELASSDPANPFPMRESSSRTGTIGT
jgi:hypothetical protein